MKKFSNCIYSSIHPGHLTICTSTIFGTTAKCNTFLHQKHNAMRKIVIFLFFSLSLAAGAQTKSGTTSGKLLVFSSLGLSSVNSDFDPASGTSIQTTTGLEWAFSSHSGVGAALNFDSYKYKQTSTSYTLDQRLRATALGLFYRYRFGTSTWQPYLKAGGGLAWLTVPTVSGQTPIKITNEAQSVGMALGEVGLQANIHSKYSFLFGVEQKWLAKASTLSDASLRTLSFRIGLISAF